MNPVQQVHISLDFSGVILYLAVLSIAFADPTGNAAVSNGIGQIHMLLSVVLTKHHTDHLTKELNE